MKMLVFDMDGTIADLYGVPNWLEKIRNENASPYIEAQPMWDMERLREVLLKLSEQGWEIRVVSWLSKDATEDFKETIRTAKRLWLEWFNFPANKVHLVQYGTTKANCVRRIASPGILIDDDEKVRNGWTLGECIDPMSCDDLPAELEKLLN